MITTDLQNLIVYTESIWCSTCHIIVRSVICLCEQILFWFVGIALSVPWLWNYKFIQSLLHVSLWYWYLEVAYYWNSRFNKLKSCYNKCVKMFFKFDRCYSVTLMLSELNLPSFDNLYAKSVHSFCNSCFTSHNALITNLVSLQLLSY